MKTVIDRERTFESLQVRRIAADERLNVPGAVVGAPGAYNWDSFDEISIPKQHRGSVGNVAVVIAGLES